MLLSPCFLHIILAVFFRLRKEGRRTLSTSLSSRENRTFEETFWRRKLRYLLAVKCFIVATDSASYSASYSVAGFSIDMAEAAPQLNQKFPSAPQTPAPSRLWRFGSSPVRRRFLGKFLPRNVGVSVLQRLRSLLVDPPLYMHDQIVRTKGKFRLHHTLSRKYAHTCWNDTCEI